MTMPCQPKEPSPAKQLAALFAALTEQLRQLDSGDASSPKA